MDNLNVHSLSWEKHMEHRRYVLLRSKEVNLKLNPIKCELAKTSLAFLEHVVSCDGT